MKFDPIDLGRHAILLDVDGTILDIAPTPRAVTVPDSLRRILTLVAERASGALALVSGRPLAELDEIFSPLRLSAIGGHGAEIRPTPGGTVHLRRVPSLDAALKAALTEISERYPGVILEDKDYSIALHYRSQPQYGPDLLREVSKLCQSHASGAVDVMIGKAVVEIKTAGFNKGTAVRELMGHAPFAGRIPIFIGDDVTDEDAFAVMPEYNGIAISVGRKVPGVERWFQTPAEVRDWLDRISREAVTVS